MQHAMKKFRRMHKLNIIAKVQLVMRTNNLHPVQEPSLWQVSPEGQPH